MNDPACAAVPHAPEDPLASSEIRTTTCCMCACRCGIRVHLRDGRPLYIDGNPRHPLNRGVICAKGSAGLMKQFSPARLTQPLRRKAGAERGAGEFEPISWDEALALLTERLGRIRRTDPKQFAFFTGRDQMQALTALFARQFGTPNYAAHGGLCSVNMAAGMIYSIGGSFWEFGGPDLERARLFVMIGTAEDHHSNPLKIALGRFRQRGGRFIAINPVRSGYAAIADEWIPIRPGSDGALFMALLHELLGAELIDRAFLQRCTNAPQLVVLDEGEREGLFAFDPAAGRAPDGRHPHNKLAWDKLTQSVVAAYPQGVEAARDLALEGHFNLPDGTRVAPSFQLLRERVADTTPEWAEALTGIPAARIRRLARELGQTALMHDDSLPIPWTDAWGHAHAGVPLRPVAFHAMRGLAAHSNGFQTVRALSVLMSVLGTIDAPGGFRHKAPYPRHIVPNYRAFNDPDKLKPDTPLDAQPLGFPASPEELAVQADGTPLRIDHAFSWAYPLAVHGLMHNVIANAARGDPYRIDTLLIYMANMAWNSSMDPLAVREALNARDEHGEHKIPFVVVCDAFQSETVAYADLVLPDTTYLERHDAMSLLDRPISEFDGPMDSVRVPVLPPMGQCRPFQDVLVELASRLRFPAFTHADGTRKYADYADFVVRYEHQPGIGFLMGWRGEQGNELRGAPNPKQWEAYARNDCVFHHRLPEGLQYRRNWNRAYLDFAKAMGWRQRDCPIQLSVYADTLQTFRLAAQGKRPGRQPPEALRERVVAWFDPLPFWAPPLEDGVTDAQAYPLHAVTQRPMAMYHSWDSQNAWLRQLHSHNALHVHPATARAAGVEDGAMCWVESRWGRVRCRIRCSEAVEPGTVWTWNAIGKAPGAWQLPAEADESRKGFLLNHLLSATLPWGEGHIANADPVTGQAGWYDVRVRLRPCEPGEPDEPFPRVETVPAPPGVLGIGAALRLVVARLTGGRRS
ncbi:molybdopterin oxidoreductase family protein [Azohydromonas caseinilytica]|uniref:molybdopterin oxidoreductase family protein n=1 Tax=Azohydromonas caseinilytica TaxID=2728836 RepID=UPI001F3A4FAD|nr:molybdopterin oxidoreductase family protein [Azohydromonas caseinilytica]